MPREAASINNISGRESIEEALRQSEAKFRTLTETAASAIFIYQGDEFRYANPAAELLTGYTSGEICGMRFWDIVHPDFHELIRRRGLARQHTRPVAVRYEFVIITKSGEERWVDYTGGAIEFEGEPAILGTAFDITERKKAEEALRQHAQELARLHTLSLDISTSAHSREELLNVIATRAAHLLEAPGASLLLCDAVSDEIKLVAESFSIQPDHLGAVVKVAEGLAGSVAQTGEALVLDDYRSWNGQAAVFEEQLPYNTVASVPLSWQSQVIGVLQVWDDANTRVFKQSDRELLTLFANQAAIAIENARLFDLEEKRVVQLESLRQASLSLTSSLDLQSVLDSILDSALHLLPGAHVAHIFLYHPQSGGQLTFGSALWLDGRRGQPVALPRPNGLTYTVARTGRSISIPDMRAHPIYNNTPAEWSGSIVGLPLKIGPRVVGVMNIASPGIGAFSEEDLSVVRLLSDQAAIAIENARLFEQAATERRHLGLLYDISKELAFSLDPDEILDRATTLTCQALNGLLGEAFLYEPDAGNQLSLRAISGRGREEVWKLEHKLKFKLGTGLVGWVGLHRQAIKVSDIKQDHRWKHVPGTDEGVHSALVAPILQGESLLGVLSLLHNRPNAFTDDHLELLQAICHQVGLALSNANRYQQVQSLVDLLAAEQNRLESLMEHLPAGVLLLDTDYHLVVANSTGRKILALFGSGGEQQAISKLGPCSIEDLTGFSGSPLPVEITFEGPPQKVFEVEARPLGDERPQWVITVREVTQERENQARIQMRERLATVGQLAAGIAHDFNNIMAAIMVYTDLLRRDMDLLPGGSERVVIIQKQVQRASSLIRQILDFSRRSVMEQSTLNMLPFIKEMDKLLERLLPETIQFELNFQPGTYLVKGDPTRLQQVFMNLALNARDAMPQGGTLSFEISRLNITPGESPPLPDLEAGEWIRLGVSDTGIGIPSEALPHIFEPFFSTKAYGEGTGLGLAQAYGIIKQHGGHIDVRSRLGEGSSFSIYLPALPLPESESESAEAYSATPGDGETILLVEDDRVTREALLAMLEAHDYRVLVSSNGRDALQIYEQMRESIDLVVSDVVMPEMGGVELYRALRQRWPQVKMLLITGHPLRKEDQAVLEGGSVQWLQKPFSIPDFSLLIKELLSEEQP